MGGDKKIPVQTKIFFSALFVICALYLVAYFWELTLINIGISLFSGLLSGMFLYFLIKWIDKDINNKIEDLQEDMRTVIDIMQDKYMTLVNQSREKTNYNNCFKKSFENAYEVKVSGIALKDFIYNLSVDFTNHPLIASLQSDMPVNIQILMAHPKSEYAKFRDMVESVLKGISTPCTADIKGSIEKLKSIVNDKSNFPRNTKPNKTFQIKLTFAPLDSAITYIKKNDSRNNSKETIFFGPLICHNFANRGPQYKLENFHKEGETSLPEHYLENFNTVFRDDRVSYTIFSWNNGKFIFHTENEKLQAPWPE